MFWLAHHLKLGENNNNNKNNSDNENNNNNNNNNNHNGSNTVVDEEVPTSATTAALSLPDRHFFGNLPAHSDENEHDENDHDDDDGSDHTEHAAFINPQPNRRQQEQQQQGQQRPQMYGRGSTAATTSEANAFSHCLDGSDPNYLTPTANGIMQSASPEQRRRRRRRRPAPFSQSLGKLPQYQYNNDDDDDDDDKDGEYQNLLLPNDSELTHPTNKSPRAMFQIHTYNNHNYNNGPDGKHMDGLLPEDTFSFFTTVPLRSKAILVACGASSIQVLVLFFLTVDSLQLRGGDQDLPQNLLHVPPTTVAQVTMSQFLALTIASISQSDCLQSMALLYNGYHEQEVLELIPPDFWRPTHHLRTRWYFSIGLRFFVGFFTIVVTFMLVVRSETVRDVMLDFTAVEFISQLDDTAYMLAAFGFFGRHVQHETTHPIFDSDALRRRSNIDFFQAKWMNTTINFLLRSILFWITTGLLAVMVVGQYNGRYLPDTLLVQMGDPSDLLLSTYSGLYELQIPSFGVFEYEERGGQGIFTWCEPEKAWTFLDSRSADTIRNCADTWRLKSTELEQFREILSVAEGGQPWYVTEEDNIELEADYARIISMLGVDTSCATGRNTNTKKNNQNDTNRDFSMLEEYGWTCKFSNPCEIIAVDALSEQFVDQRTWPTFFNLMPDILVYEHPVYYNRIDGLDSFNAQGIPTSNADLVLFTGRRWVMLSTNAWVNSDEEDEQVILTDDEIRQRLENFRVYKFEGNLGVGFVSEDVDVGTFNDQGTPIGLRWFDVERGTQNLIPQINDRFIVSARFSCAICNDEDQQCLYGAACVDGTCQCDGDDLGFRCEVVPSSNGFCNPSFNRPDFDHDGGDCCPVTCVDTEENTCLKSKDNLIDYGNGLCRSRDQLFLRKLPVTEPDYVGDWNNPQSVAPGISLSQDGRTFALSYRIVDKTTIGYKVGSTWSDFPLNHEFGGYHNEIVSLFPGSIGGHERRLPVKGLAASFTKRTLTSYACQNTNCEAGNFNMDSNRSNSSLANTVVPPHFGLADYWDPFALSSDGRVMARGGAYTAEGQFADIYNPATYNQTVLKYFVDIYVRDPNTNSGWVHTNQSIDLTVNRTEVIGTELQDAPCLLTSNYTLDEFLDVVQLNLTTILQLSNLDAVDILEASDLSVQEIRELFDENRTTATISATTESTTNTTVETNATESTPESPSEASLSYDELDVDLYEFIQITNYPLDTFLGLTTFNETNYGLEFCKSPPRRIYLPVYGKVTRTTEVPVYLSLSDLRRDGTRRLAVGSLYFAERSPNELFGNLTTRVFEVSQSGTLVAQGPAVKLIDVSSRHGKSTSDVSGMPKKAVSLSDDGNVLAVGSIYLKTNDEGDAYEEGVVKVFEWKDGEWSRRQSIVLGRNDTNPGIRSGWSNVLSTDGSVLAITIASNSTIYRWNASFEIYNLESTDLPFSAGTDVSVSASGGVVGFGAPVRGSFGAFVYQNDRAPWCTLDQRMLRVSYTPTAKERFTWRLFSPGNSLLAEDGWPTSVLEDPLDKYASPIFQPLQVDVDTDLDVETTYASDNPADLTFAYNLCLNFTLCSDVYFEDNVGDRAFGVAYKRAVVNATAPPTSSSCRLELQTAPIK